MATHIITIFATNSSPSPLIISDDENHTASTADGDKNLTTNLLDGDTIKWVNGFGSNISSIDAVTQGTVTFGGHTGKFPAFKAPPVKGDDGSWSAIAQLGQNITMVNIEYSITYTINGKQYTQDPKLQIRKN